jgi:hypothetical protein
MNGTTRWIESSEGVRSLGWVGQEEERRRKIEIVVRECQCSFPSSEFPRLPSSEILGHQC